MNPKFKIGDRVIILADHYITMGLGTAGIIVRITHLRGFPFYMVEEQRNCLGFEENEIELDTRYYFNQNLNKIIND